MHTVAEKTVAEKTVAETAAAVNYFKLFQNLVKYRKRGKILLVHGAWLSPDRVHGSGP